MSARAGSRPQRHKLTIAYDGTAYSGWQRQPGKVTVQGELEKVAEEIWGEPVSVQASGRTDTGVHALGQVASFTARRLHKGDVLERAFNAKLPPTVRVLSVRLVPADFHARFLATGKTYRYRIDNAPVANPLDVHRSWHIPRPLNVRAMRRAARLLRGKQDFASFTSNPGYERETTVRTVRRVTVTAEGSEIHVTVSADGFLYRMVRNIVAALVRVGQGRMTVEAFDQIRQARSRSAAPGTAPPHGLYLMHVEYGRTPPSKPTAE